MESILSNEKRCYVCGSQINLHRHHIYFGTSNRKNSEIHGCWVWLCAYHHNLSDEGVHFNHMLDLALKQECQRAFEKEHSREEFREIFGKSWL